MNQLDHRTRTRILGPLCGGNSIRTVSRFTGASKNTVLRLLCDVGMACSDYQNRALRQLVCKHIKIIRVGSILYAPTGVETLWTWLAVCLDSRLAISWKIGGHDFKNGVALLDDIRHRLVYPALVTIEDRTIHLGRIKESTLAEIYGRTHAAIVSTGERQRTVMSVGICWFSRFSSKGFSRKPSNHHFAIALHSMYHNFVRFPTTRRATPAMLARVSRRRWDIGDFVDLLQEFPPTSEDHRLPAAATSGLM